MDQEALNTLFDQALEHARRAHELSIKLLAEHVNGAHFRLDRVKKFCDVIEGADRVYTTLVRLGTEVGLGQDR
jgi:hypothetical protein